MYNNLNLCTVFLHQNIFDALDIHHWSIILSIALLQQGLLVFLLVTVVVGFPVDRWANIPDRFG